MANHRSFLFVFYSLMKKIICYTSLLFAIILFINIAQILITDLGRLTQYGIGYLVGKEILLLVFLSIAYSTKNNKKFPKK